MLAPPCEPIYQSEFKDEPSTAMVVRILSEGLSEPQMDVLERKAWEIEHHYQRRFNSLWDDLCEGRVKFNLVTKNNRSFAFRGDGWEK